VPVAYTTSCQLKHHGEQLHTQQQHPWLCRCSSTNVAVNLGSFNSSGDAHEPWLQGTTTCYRHRQWRSQKARQLMPKRNQKHSMQRITVVQGVVLTVVHNVT
jgi:hypothetical protein